MKAPVESAPPRGWRRARIGEIFTLVRGVSFPKGANTKQPADAYIACLRTTNVQATVEWADVWYVPRIYVRRPEQMVRVGDILISTANSLNLVGKVSLVTVMPCEATLGAFIGLIRAPATIDSRFTYYQMNSLDVQADIRSRASTTTNISNVSTTNLAEVELAFPPLPEQHRIVAEIEKQFTRLDASMAALERVRANLKRYRAATLAAACEGRLVPTEAALARAEGREYEDANALLTRLGDLNDAGKSKPDTSLSLVSDVLPSAPTGWTWVGLGQLMTLLRNGVSIKPTAIAGTAILRISAVRPLAVNASDVRFLDADVARDAKYAVESGDILFTRYNGNPQLVGVCGVVKNLARTTLHPDKLIRVKIASPLAPELVAMLLSAGYSRSFLAKRVRTTAGQAGISGGDLKQVPVCIPPLAEQHRIVAEVERRLSLVDKLEAVVADALKHGASLRQSILKRAFAGELVAQDPSDEPASALLDRLRAERAAQTTNGSGRAEHRERRRREQRQRQ